MPRCHFIAKTDVRRIVQISFRACSFTKGRTCWLERLEARELLFAGGLDPTFNFDGRVTTDIGGHGTDDFGYDAVAYQSDGKVIVSGYANQPSTGQDFAVVRYNADGSLDSSFGNGGIVTIDFAFSSDVGRGVTLDSQGRILVSGYSYQGGTTGYDFAVARLTSSGALDGSFSGDGKQTIDFGSFDDFGWGVAVDSQDNVLVAGYSNQGATGNDFAVARLTSSGALDGSFSGDGKQTVNFGTSNDIGYGVAVDSQDNVLVAGYSYQGGTTGYDFAVARLTSSARWMGPSAATASKYSALAAQMTSATASPSTARTTCSWPATLIRAERDMTSPSRGSLVRRAGWIIQRRRQTDRRLRQLE